MGGRGRHPRHAPQCMEVRADSPPPCEHPAFMMPCMTTPLPLKTVTVGLLGCGTVGQDVLTLLLRRRDIFAYLLIKPVLFGAAGSVEALARALDRRPVLARP